MTVPGATIEQARTVAVNACVAMEIGYPINCRALDKSSDRFRRRSRHNG